MPQWRKQKLAGDRTGRCRLFIGSEPKEKGKYNNKRKTDFLLNNKNTKLLFGEELNVSLTHVSRHASGTG